jgi:hypothetical protein
MPTPRTTPDWRPSACAAFSGRGDLARVDAKRESLLLRVSLQSGGEQSTVESTPKGQIEGDCHLFFNQSGSMLAIATRLYTAEPLAHKATANQADATLQVRIWSLTEGKWKSEFNLGGHTGNAWLEGFWLNTDRLVVGGIERAGLKGRLSMVTARGNPVTDWHMIGNGLLDVRRGVKWVDAGENGCVRRQATLTDVVPETSGANEIRLPSVQGDWCTVMEPVSFPLPGMLADVTTERENRVWVWTAGPGASNSAKILLPPPKRGLFVSWNEAHATITSSPGGRFLSVDRSVTNWVLDEPQRWDDVWLIQTQPLMILKRIHPAGCKELRAVAVGDFGGIPHVAMNWCGKWELQTNTSPKPGRRQ